MHIAFSSVEQGELLVWVKGENEKHYKLYYCVRQSDEKVG